MTQRVIWIFNGENADRSTNLDVLEDTDAMHRPSFPPPLWGLSRRHPSRPYADRRFIDDVVRAFEGLTQRRRQI